MPPDVKDKEEPGGLKDLLTSFADSTTMHGLASIASPSKRRFTRFLWLLLVLVFAGWACYNVTLVILSYLAYPVSTIVSVRYEQSLKFPAVTICNLNNLRRTPYMKSNAMQGLLEQQKRFRLQTGLEEARGAGRDAIRRVKRQTGRITASSVSTASTHSTISASGPGTILGSGQQSGSAPSNTLLQSPVNETTVQSGLTTLQTDMTPQGTDATTQGSEALTSTQPSTSSSTSQGQNLWTWLKSNTTPLNSNWWTWSGLNVTPLNSKWLTWSDTTPLKTKWTWSGSNTTPLNTNWWTWSSVIATPRNPIQTPSSRPTTTTSKPKTTTTQGMVLRTWTWTSAPWRSPSWTRAPLPLPPSTTQQPFPPSSPPSRFPLDDSPQTFPPSSPSSSPPPSSSTPSPSPPSPPPSSPPPSPPSSPPLSPPPSPPPPSPPSSPPPPSPSPPPPPPSSPPSVPPSPKPKSFPTPEPDSSSLTTQPESPDSDPQTEDPPKTDYFWDDYSFTPVQTDVLEEEEESRANIRNYMDSLGAKERFRYGHHLAKMLIDCTYQRNIKCSHYNFTRFYNHYFGNCYTFNKDEAIITAEVSKAGPLHGLSLLLNVDTDEYLVESDTVGFKVLVHPQGTMPFPEDEGVIVSPGFASSIAIQKLHLKRSPPPYGNCKTYSQEDNLRLNMYARPPYAVNYSDKACQRTCYQRRVVQECQCYDSDYPFPENSGTITADKVRRCNVKKEDRCLTAIHDKLEAGNLDCDDECISACEEVVYTQEVSMGVWPSEASLGGLEDRFRVLSDTFLNYTDVSFFRKNIAKINIFFKQLNYQRIETHPAYDWYRLLSDLGGQLGLWLGVSLLTAAEFLELGFTVVWHLANGLHRTGTKLGRSLVKNGNGAPTPV